MRRALPATTPLIIGLLGVGLHSAGCAKSPPPPRVPVPAEGNQHVTRERDPVKPLPDERTMTDVGPLYEDVPLVTQRPPEQQFFVDAYRRVGSPKIAVFVNRTLEGQIIPVNPDVPVAAVERTRRATTGVTVERRDEFVQEDRYWDERDRRERIDRFETTGPGEYRESTEVFLRPGEYDEVQAKAIDYEAMESILTDWLSADGQVSLMSPMMTRQRLTDEQVKELQSGRPQVLRELAEQLDTDVLVQVQARPTRQTPEGLGVRLIAEAINTRGGESIGRSVVDIPPPLDKWQLNKYTRYVARKLMDGMGASWNAPAPQRGAGGVQQPSPEATPTAPAQPQSPQSPPPPAPPAAPATQP